MRKYCHFLYFLAFTLFTANMLPAQEGEPWTDAQLMNAADLAELLTDNEASDLPLILAVNPDGMHRMAYDAGIKGAKWFGAADNEENLDRLEAFLKDIDREADIVLYCGCCPFTMCPNVRPAFELLNRMGFKNHKLLDLPENIVDDWIDHGYPMKD